MFFWMALTFVVAVGHCCFARAGLKLQVCLPMVTKAETSGFLASAGVSGPASCVSQIFQEFIQNLGFGLSSSFLSGICLLPFQLLWSPWALIFQSSQAIGFCLSVGYSAWPQVRPALWKTVIRKHRNWFVLVSSSKCRSLWFLSLGSLQCCGCFFQTSWSLTGDRWLDNSWQWFLCVTMGATPRVLWGVIVTNS